MGLVARHVVGHVVWHVTGHISGHVLGHVVEHVSGHVTGFYCSQKAKFNKENLIPISFKNFAHTCKIDP